MKTPTPPIMLAFLFLTGNSNLVRASPKPIEPPTQGHSQMAGGDAKFGVIYTLKNNFNFVIYGAHYTLEPMNCYGGGLAPKADEKLLVFDVAFKNVLPADGFLNNDGLFTVVDTTGQLYNSFAIEQDSQGRKGYNANLKPGQGIGQPELKDGVHVAFKVPAKARVVKIIVNVGRKFVKPDEKIVRYYVAGATKAEAGADGDPKNVIAALPANVVDSTDKSGATALDEGKGAIGQEFPSQRYHLKLNSISTTSDAIKGNAPQPNKKYVVLNVTAKLAIDVDLPLDYVMGGDYPTWQLVDGDGDTYKPVLYLKASLDEPARHDFKIGDEYTFRIVFQVPKTVTFKKLVMGAGDSRKWAFDGTIIQ